MATNTMQIFSKRVMSQCGKTRGWTKITYEGDNENAIYVLGGPFMGTWSFTRAGGRSTTSGPSYWASASTRTRASGLGTSGSTVWNTHW